MFKIIKNFNWIILSSFLCIFMGIVTFLTFINEVFVPLTDNNLQTLLEKSIESNKDTMSELLPRIGNTTNINNQMTVNIFLNEECKNAISLNEFLRGLDLSLEDLIYTSENGYIKGIANIFAKNLQDMKPTERPIHCSDQKQLQFYVKDENDWEPDNKNIKIDRSIEHITQKQIQKIKDWEKEHPNWSQTDNETQLYMNMIKEVVGGMNDEDKEKKLADIKRELGIKTDLTDAINKDNNIKIK